MRVGRRVGPVVVVAALALLVLVPVGRAAAAPPDLSIAMTASPDPAGYSRSLNYSITVTNQAGSGDATGVTLTDPVPSGLTYSGAYPISQGSCSQAGGSVTCNLGDLAAGATASLTISFTVTTQTHGTVTNTATVDSDQPDANPSDNSAMVTSTITDDANLSATLTVGPYFANVGLVGRDLSYTLEVKNNGPSVAFNPTLTVHLPPNLRYDGGDIRYCPQSGGDTVTCHSLVLLAGETLGIYFSVEPTATGPNTTTTLTVSSAQPDPDLSDNTSSATIPVVYAEAGAFGEQVQGLTTSGPLPEVSTDLDPFDCCKTLAGVDTGTLQAQTLYVEGYVPEPDSYAGLTAASASVAHLSYYPFSARGVQARCDGDLNGQKGTTSIGRLQYQTNVANLTLLDVHPPPNTWIPVNGGSLTLNEQLFWYGRLTINAIHFRSPQADVIVSQAHCTIRK